MDELLTGAQSTLLLEPGRAGSLALRDADGRLVYRAAPGAGARPVLLRLPIQVDGRVVGYLELEQGRWRGPRGPANRPAVPDPPGFLDELRRFFLQVALVGGILSLVFGFLLSRSLTAPLNRLAQAARAIGARDLSYRVPEEGTEEIREVARAFNEMAEGLERAERLRRNLLADVAHELRTPLTVLQGSLRAILDDVYALDKEEVARLYEQTRTLHRLVDDLHQLAQAEARQLPLNRRPLDLAGLVQEVTGLFAPLAEDRGVDLQVELASAPLWVDGDRERLAQVLHNLLNNALRHTPPGGRIWVRARPQGDSICLEVADTGEGIPAEDLPYIFERFYRTDRARSRDEGGAGLGLAIVRALVEAHGGRVEAHSPGPGQGATFRVFLPAGREGTDEER